MPQQIEKVGNYAFYNTKILKNDIFRIGKIPSTSRSTSHTDKIDASGNSGSNGIPDISEYNEIFDKLHIGFNAFGFDENIYSAQRTYDRVNPNLTTFKKNLQFTVNSHDYINYSAKTNHTTESATVFGATADWTKDVNFPGVVKGCSEGWQTYTLNNVYGNLFVSKPFELLKDWEITYTAMSNACTNGEATVVVYLVDEDGNRVNEGYSYNRSIRDKDWDVEEGYRYKATQTKTFKYDGIDTSKYYQLIVYSACYNLEQCWSGNNFGMISSMSLTGVVNDPEFSPYILTIDPNGGTYENSNEKIEYGLNTNDKIILSVPEKMDTILMDGQYLVIVVPFKI